MPRLLFYDSGKEWGGGTNSLFFLIENLNRKVFDISVHFEYDYGFRDGTISSEVEKDGFRFIDPSKKNLPKFKKELFRIRGSEYLKKKVLDNDIKHAMAILNQAKPDILHLNNQPSSNLHALIASNKLGIKTVLHLRKNVLLSQAEKKVLSGLDFKSIAVSQSTKDFYAKQGLGDITVVYNPVVAKNNLNETMEIDDGKINILVAANYIPIKGHDLLFESLNTLKRDDVKVYLAGSGQFDKKTEAMKEALLKKGIIEELGFVNLENVYRNMDYVMLLSKSEGLPRVVIEALSYGCGIVMSDIEVAHELKSLFKNTAFYIVPRDQERVKSVLKKLRKLEEHTVGQDGLHHFSLNAYVDAIGGVYASLL